MMTAKIAVVTRISVRVKPRCSCRTCRDIANSPFALQAVDFGRVENRNAPPVLGLFPGDVGADLQKARGRPRAVLAIRRIRRTARSEHEADARIREFAFIDES